VGDNVGCKTQQAANDDMLTLIRNLSPLNTAAVTAHGEHKPALRPHRSSTQRVATQTPADAPVPLNRPMQVNPNPQPKPNLFGLLRVNS